MRKAYMTGGGERIDETVFVEDDWTRVWEEQGGPEEKIDKSPIKEEYRHTRSSLTGLPQGAICWMGVVVQGTGGRV